MSYVVGCQYEGLRYEEGNCGVSIMRSGKNKKNEPNFIVTVKLP